MKHKIVNPSTTCPRESLNYLWSFSSVSWKLCECMSMSRLPFSRQMSRRMHVTSFERLSLYSWPLQGYGRFVNRSATCTVESLTYLWSFNSISVNALRINIFEWLILYSLPLLRYGRIVNLSSTFHVESLTYLWNFNYILKTANACWICVFLSD